MSVNPIKQNDPNATVIGEMISVTPKVNTRVLFGDLGDKLDAAGLDRKLARTLAASYAFRRAIRDMARAKLVDDIEESADELTFQISNKVPVSDGVEYHREAVVTLDKATGAIACADAVVEAAARTAFQKHLGERRTSDVSNLIRRILGQHLNKMVFPHGRGSYFVNAAAVDLVDKLETFVTSLGWSMTRWAISEGAGKNTVQVQTVVVDSFMESISQIEDVVYEINSESSEVKIRNAKAKMEQINLDLQYNARRIGDQLGRLEDYLATCEALLARQQNVAPAEVTAPWREEDCDGTDDGEDVPAEAIRLPSTVSV